MCISKDVSDAKQIKVLTMPKQMLLGSVSAARPPLPLTSRDLPPPTSHLPPPTSPRHLFGFSVLNILTPLLIHVSSAYLGCVHPSTAQGGEKVPFRGEKCDLSTKNYCALASSAPSSSIDAPLAELMISMAIHHSYQGRPPTSTPKAHLAQTMPTACSTPCLGARIVAFVICCAGFQA